MRAGMKQAGLRLRVESALPWTDRMLREACGSTLADDTGETPDVDVVVSAEKESFGLVGWAPLTRGAFCRGGDVVLTNACGSGFDLRVETRSRLGVQRIGVEARFRPPTRERIAAHALRSRFHLLTRAVLLQYPALWVAGLRGLVPLHAAAVSVGDAVPLLVGPGGVGRSTLLLQALADGGRACSDNLCTSDGWRAHGVVEPVRVEGLRGRRMPHGRAEGPLPNRVDALVPDRLVVLQLAGSGSTHTRTLSSAQVAQVLTAGTYMAGELRRYWAFAATLAMGTGIGLVHPPVQRIAEVFAQRLPAIQITLGSRPSPALAELLRTPTELAS
jgi:hypothetical protein